MYEALDKLSSAEINSMLSVRLRPMASPEGGLELTGDGNLARFLQDGETSTNKLLSAIKKTLVAMPLRQIGSVRGWSRSIMILTALSKRGVTARGHPPLIPACKLQKNNEE
jgi:hypothetical protein